MPRRTGAKATPQRPQPTPPKTKVRGNTKADVEWLEIQLNAGRLYEYDTSDGAESPCGARYQWQGYCDEIEPQWFLDRARGTRRCSSTAVIRDDTGAYVTDLNDEPLRRPCLFPPVLGANVCRMHGGSTEHIKRGAAIRLAEASNKAADTLIRLTDPTDELGTPVEQKVRVQAANSVLDRVGIKGGVEVEVTTPGFKRVLERMFGDDSEEPDDGSDS